ncbi:MAG TPA: twin-arginine translocase subunit TatC [Pyrinomonadaceae bacterium]|nr:twin-arginine translocase subunit TatC [Pyrinomonadaceae bacterium]
MASTLLESEDTGDEQDSRLGGQMSFLDHLDELRRRLVRSIIFVVVVFMACWFVSDYIYNFLARPVLAALADAQRRQLPLGGITGSEAVLPLTSAREHDTGRYVFTEMTKLGANVIPVGTSVAARVARDAGGQLGLFTDEPIYAGGTIIPKGVRLPFDLNAQPEALPGLDDRLVVNTALEPFSLYVKVSLYTAVCLSVPFLLWQIWAFVAPGLYPHERGYAVPFVILASVFFVGGAAFAYYIIFPPAARYLLGLGQDFRLLLKANDYFDFIIFIMLGMGLIFQMPAVTYILARIGLVTAWLLVRIWKTSLIVIFVAAAFISPTSDVLNMMLFAAPMLVLYVISIFVAWIFGRARTTTEVRG